MPEQNPEKVRITMAFEVEPGMADYEWQQRTTDALRALGERAGALADVRVGINVTPHIDIAEPKALFLEPRVEARLRSSVDFLLDNAVVSDQDRIKIHNLFTREGLNSIKAILAIGSNKLRNIRGLGNKYFAIVQDALLQIHPDLALHPSPDLNYIASFCELSDLPREVLKNWYRNGESVPIRYDSSRARNVKQLLDMPVAELADNLNWSNDDSAQYLEFAQEIKAFVEAYASEFTKAKDRHDIIKDFKRFAERGIIHPGDLSETDSEVAEALNRFRDWHEREVLAAAGDSTPESSIRHSLRASMLFIDAGYTDPSYLDEVANDLLQNDISDAKDAGLEYLAREIQRKVDEINAMIARMSDKNRGSQ